VRSRSSIGTGWAQSSPSMWSEITLWWSTVSRSSTAFTDTLSGRMRGSKSRIACRSARSSWRMSSPEAVSPESGGSP